MYFILLTHSILNARRTPSDNKIKKTARSSLTQTCKYDKRHQIEWFIPPLSKNDRSIFGGKYEILRMKPPLRETEYLVEFSGKRIEIMANTGDKRNRELRGIGK